MGFNRNAIIRVVSISLLITGVAMAFPVICAIYYGEFDTIHAFYLPFIISIVLGLLGIVFTKGNIGNLKVRDSYLVTFLTWFVCSLIGSLPYLMSGTTSSFIDAFFESVAGYTTTGATIILSINFTHSLVLWKAITHWIGGMGILVFLVSLLPALGIGGHRINSAESPGPDITKLVPRSSEFARLLYGTYMVLSLVEFLLLYFGSTMSIFDAIINTMGSISTAGFFMHPSGISFYNSIFVEFVLTIFPLLSACNYVLYISFIKRHFDNLRTNTEIRWFLGMIVGFSTLVSLNLFFEQTYETLAECFRHGFFQVCSFISTAGFVLDNYSIWPSFSKLFMVFLLFVGGCGSSTSGGIKIIRVQILFKSLYKSFIKKLHPRAVYTIKDGDKVIPTTAVSTVVSFVILYMATYLFAVLVMSLDGNSLETTLTAPAAILSTTGIFFGGGGTMGNFFMFSEPTRLFMTILMLIGRLELYSVFLLFVPSFWNPDRAKNN